MVVVEIIGERPQDAGGVYETRGVASEVGHATAPVPPLNVVLPHLGNLPAKCSGRVPSRLKVVRNFVCALVPQVKIAFWDEEEVEESPERTIQTREFPALVPVVVVTVESAEHARWLFSSGESRPQPSEHQQIASTQE